MRRAAFLVLLLSGCSWEPFAAPVVVRHCTRAYADTITVTATTNAVDTTITVGACR